MSHDRSLCHTFTAPCEHLGGPRPDDEVRRRIMLEKLLDDADRLREDAWYEAHGGPEDDR